MNLSSQDATPSQAFEQGNLLSDTRIDRLLSVAIASTLSLIFAKSLGSNHPIFHGVLQVYLTLRQNTSSSPIVSIYWTSLVAFWIWILTWVEPSILFKRVRTTASPGAPSFDRTGRLYDREQGHDKKDEADTPSVALPFYRPLIFPSRTSHRRVFPKPHSFNYSYLLVGVPIRGNTITSNGMVSVHPSCSSEFESPALMPPKEEESWFSVHSADYLQRGPAFSHLSLRQKLNLYLLSQGVKSPDQEFPFVYLVTAPRFAGFSFNPVSFWYLYDEDGVLSAMILEVNNTFDERRVYYLQENSRLEDGHDDLAEVDERMIDTESMIETRGGKVLSTSRGNEKMMENRKKKTSRRFTSKWDKDFHVSPFNDRDGTYSVTAIDILRTGKVDVTIVLSGEEDQGLNGHSLASGDKDTESGPHVNSSKSAASPPYDTPSTSAPSCSVTESSDPKPPAGSPQSMETPPPAHSNRKPKIIARIFSLNSSTTSDMAHIDPSHLSTTQRLKVALRYGLTGFLTNPRILIEARKLWAMGLTVFYRPEPFNSTIPRVETRDEIVLEEAFKRLLERAVRLEKWTGILRYKPAAGIRRGQIVTLDREADVSASEEGRVRVEQGADDQGTDGEKTSCCLEIHVLTPAFYNELAKINDQNGGLKGLFDRSCFQAPPKEKTVYCSSADHLLHLLQGEHSQNDPQSHSNLKEDCQKRDHPVSVTFRMQFGYVRLVTWIGILSIFRLHGESNSAFDKRIREASTVTEYTEYLRASATVLVADVIAFGSVGLLRFQLSILRMLVVACLTRMVVGPVSHLL